MVDWVSDATDSSMEKQTGGKVQEQGGVLWQCNNPANIRCLQDTLWIHCNYNIVFYAFIYIASGLL